VTELPTFIAVGEIRCCARDLNLEIPVCGRAARWVRDVRGTTIPEFACDAHRLATDRELAGVQLVRRVSVTAEVLFCGTSMHDTLARAEALRQLEAAVQRVGGFLNLVDVRSQIGRFPVPPAAERALRGGGGR
jgi:hypothetical protein